MLGRHVECSGPEKPPIDQMHAFEGIGSNGKDRGNLQLHPLTTNCSGS